MNRQMKPVHMASTSSSSPFSSLAESSLVSLEDHVPDFVNVDERYRCAICHNVLKDPVQTKCGHRLCEGCVEALFQQGEPVTCPQADEYCEKLMRSDIYPDVSARREIRNLPVYCPFKSYGCGRNVPLKDVNKHATDCTFKPVECPNRHNGCKEILPQKSLDAHVKQCQYRQVQCDQCRQPIPIAMAQKHKESDCPEANVACPYKCGAPQMKRKELERHFNVCKKKPQECKFKSVGCTYTGSAQDIAEHEKRDISQHLELVTMYTGNMDLQSMQIRAELGNITTERDHLKVQLEKTLSENASLKESVGKLETTFRDMRLKMVSQTERVIKLERRVEELPRKEHLEQQSRELTTLREQSQSLTDQIAGMEGGQTVARYGSLSTMADAFTTQLAAHDRQIGIHDVRIAEMDLRFQILETASYDGVLLWKIRDYTRRKQEAVSGRTLSLYSQPFYTSKYGYKMCARVYLNGDGMGKTTHVSLFFVIMRGEYDSLLPWPFQQKVTLYLLDQGVERRHLSDHFHPDPSSSSFRKPQTEMNIASGCPLFVSHSVLENPTNNYLKDDTIFIKIAVETANLRIV
ncbi:TNF receptor-associated factor 3-like isoform X2 [Haliotis rufescens]|uniref:TNF receptor-associated factor 3-like isoform X2 n=1 Tax=Haliotis rufescens TaxID=6454 RepID=UPI001EB01F2A|nr:TNF receptor-associated factor 3-like isoform X2 [Haliotis rufescens]XP_048259607.1 TNF receptor-associated factor 3-like isoform X2 [Haliotis rufescens]